MRCMVKLRLTCGALSAWDGDKSANVGLAALSPVILDPSCHPSVGFICASPSLTLKN